MSSSASIATPNSSKPIRRELSPAAAADAESEEMMTPRPALPSFGSVRSRKTPSPDVVEKITETVPDSTSTSVATLPDRVEGSNDDMIGAILANHYAAKKAAAQEPLSPQVTSTAASGYASDSSTSSKLPSTDRFTLASSGTIQEKEKELVDLPRDTSESASFAPPALQESTSREALAVPDISVQPATPGTEEDQPILDSPGRAAEVPAKYSIPGGWEESEGSKSDSAISTRVEPIVSEEPDFESSDEEGEFAAPDTRSAALEPIYESDSDKSDAFSDAAEDPSEFDGGFASLDAILESPVQPNSPPFAVSTPPDSPASRLPPSGATVSQPSTTQSTEPATELGRGWGDATAYWSSLTRERREQMERQAQSVEDEKPAPILPTNPKKRTQAAPAITVPTAKPVQSPVNPPTSLKSPSEQPNSRPPAIKKTMRQPAEPTPTSAPAAAPSSNPARIRTSMRSGGGGGGAGMRTSMRQEPTPGSSADIEPRGALQKKRLPPAASSSSVGAAAAAVRKPPVPAAPPKAVNAPTDDSDSESSFRKQRRRESISTVDSQGPYSMKRSMRGNSVDVGADRRPISPTPAPRGSGRFSVRSLSPNGSFMDRNRGETLRASLRGPVDDAPTMRGKNNKAMRDSKSPTGFGMSGFSKSARPASATGGPPPAPRNTPKPSKATFRSRFVDSDDEDDNVPSTGFGFRSRFADSDEEDSPVAPPKRMPANLAPVRGIPRKDREDDSTDLDDSDNESRPGKANRANGRVASKPGVPSESDIEAAMAAARRNVAAMNGGREPGTAPETNGVPKKQVRVDPEPQVNGTNEAIGPASPAIATPVTPTKRRGFMGSMLGRRRNSSVASVPQIPSSYFASPAGTVNPQSPMPQGQSPSGKLQRKTTQRMNSSMSIMSQAPPTGQQKTNAPSAAQNWPLAPPPKVNPDGDARPATSDGVEMRRTMRGGDIARREPRPDLGRRSLSGGDLDRKAMGQKNAVYSERTGKKKRFGKLRNIFGLND